VAVTAQENEKELIMEITDNGIGIDNSKVKNFKTLGIMGMNERVVLLGGTLDIKGIKNKGTTTILKIPFKK
jgi:signal transduction histidine kinase